MNDDRRRAWARGAGLVLLLCVLCTAATLRTGAASPHAQNVPKAVDLVPAIDTCAQPGAAGAHATTLLARAVARIDRYPFDARNGVIALSELSEARLCALRAADHAQAELARETLRRFSARVEA